MKVNERREIVQKFRLWINSPRCGHRSKDCKSRTCTVPNCGQRHKKPLHSDFSKKEATTCASVAPIAVALNITPAGVPVVHIKLVNENTSLSVLALCDTRCLNSFVDKSSTLHLQGRKTSFSVAGIHGSQDVRTEIVPIAVSAHKNFRLMSTIQFYVYEKVK